MASSSIASASIALGVTRAFYLLALGALQAMLAWQLVPIIALVLARHIPLGHAADGWPAAVEVLAAALAVIGAGLSVAYPCIAILRHVQRGPQRFEGLPHWAVTVTLIGAALLGGDALLRLLGPWLPTVDDRPLRSMLPLAAPGVALMCAGALFAELLRRSRPLRRSRLAALGPIVRVTRERVAPSPDPAERLDRAA